MNNFDYIAHNTLNIVNAYENNYRLTPRLQEIEN